MPEEDTGCLLAHSTLSPFRQGLSLKSTISYRLTGQWASGVVPSQPTLPLNPGVEGIWNHAWWFYCCWLDFFLLLLWMFWFWWVLVIKVKSFCLYNKLCHLLWPHPMAYFLTNLGEVWRLSYIRCVQCLEQWTHIEKGWGFFLPCCCYGYLFFFFLLLLVQVCYFETDF